VHRTLRGHTVMLRLARPDEAAALAALSRELIEAGLAWRYTPRRVAALIGAADTSVVLASGSPGSDIGSDIDGFAAMQFGDENAHLVLLCVRASLQRRGIGRALHDWLMRSAQVAGIGSVTLELRADNSGALAFYRALGYAAFDTVAGYYDGRIAARRMLLRLRQDETAPPAGPAG
jgi:[ribosomal protein S18]-alanine N-acetyltransferase